jgi:hypothetical protein
LLDDINQRVLALDGSCGTEQKQGKEELLHG